MHIHVACAIERNGLVLAARRSAAKSHAAQMGISGRKNRSGESPEVCVKRELWEEMGFS